MSDVLRPLSVRMLAFMSVLSLVAPGVASAQAVPEVQAAPEANPDDPEVPVPTPLVVMVPAEPETPGIPAVWAPVPRDAEGRTAYGLYLSGRNAMTNGETREGAARLTAAQALTPEQPTVREQAFTAVLLSGDLDDAARISPTGPDVSRALSEAGRLVSVVQLYANGDARAALSAMESPILPPHGRAAALVKPWIAAAAGDWDAAVTEANPAATDVVSRLIRYQRAQLLEVRRRYDEADAAYQAATAGSQGQALFRMGYGQFLERRGRRDEALAIYDAALAANADEPQALAAKARVMAGGRPPTAPTLREGAASALILAAALASSEGADEFAAVYVRLALNISPSDEARLSLGQTLAKAGIESAAREAYSQIGPGNPDAYAAARVQIAAVYSQDDQPDEALVELRRAYDATPADPRLAQLIAGQLLQLERYDEALAILNGPTLMTANQAPDLHFMRGATYESLGRIPEAEAELWAALQARPDDPTYLNYLGYLWVDSGRRVSEGAEMIARAFAAEPDNGNIQDSLGWAQYRQGQYEVAVETLEAAVDKEPANAEINDHLGDAYWQVGRRREAGFQWTRVLTLDPDDDRKASVEAKLANGLTPPTPVSGQP